MTYTLGPDSMAMTTMSPLATALPNLTTTLRASEPRRGVGWLWTLLGLSPGSLRSLAESRNCAGEGEHKKGARGASIREGGEGGEQKGKGPRGASIREG